MAENHTKLQKSPWKAVDIVLPALLLLPTADFAAIQGGAAARLGITGAVVTQYSPLLMIMVAILCPLVLWQTRLARFSRGITLILVVCCVVSAPALLNFTTSSIPLSRVLTYEELTNIDRVFYIPVVHYGASGEGHQLRVRRADDTSQLREHFTILGALASTNSNNQTPTTRGEQ